MTFLLVAGGAWLLVLVGALCLARSNATSELRYTEPTSDVPAWEKFLGETRFVDLPGWTGQLAADLKSSTPSQQTSQTDADERTIFLVEDDPAQLNLLKQVLRSEGFNVCPFNNPQMALNAMNQAQTKPHLLVTDFRMQPMNGLDLIDRCRSVQPLLKCIVISGNVDDESLDNFKLTTDRLLSKPFPVSSLVNSVRESLDECAVVAA